MSQRFLKRLKVLAAFMFTVINVWCLLLCVIVLIFRQYEDVESQFFLFSIFAFFINPLISVLVYSFMRVATLDKYMTERTVIKSNVVCVPLSVLSVVYFLHG